MKKSIGIQSNMYLIRISEETGKEAIFEEINSKSFPDFWKDHNFSVEKRRR